MRVRLAMTIRKRIRKAQILIVQAKPTSTVNLLTIIGKITPPRLEPEKTIPNANARRSLNQVETEAVATKKIADAPIGLQTP